MEAFTAFYQAVPRPLRSRVPLEAVHVLLEMVADDAARRRCGAAPVREALALLGDAVGPDAAAGLGEAARDRRRRLARLADAGAGSMRLSVAAATTAAGLLVLPTVIVVVPWLGRALSAWPL
jgi:hypothetical protein